jgi:hypothetical protein
MGLLFAGGFHCGIPWANGHIHFSRLGPEKIVNVQREAMLESHGGASSIRQSDVGRPPRDRARRSWSALRLPYEQLEDQSPH